MPTFDDVRRIALALPEASEVPAWEGEITFRVNNRIFVMEQDWKASASLKATPLDQADLIDRDPETFRKAAYVGRFGWVSVDLERVALDELERLIRGAWRLTAPKRLVAAHDDV
jgi:hypothetical protein